MKLETAQLYARIVWRELLAILAWFLAATVIFTRDPIDLGFAVYFAVVYYGSKKLTNNLTINVSSNVESEATVSVEAPTKKENGQ